MQVMELVCPVASENLRASQLVQTAAAAADWYLPAVQSAQVEAEVAPQMAPNLPAVQSMQVTELVCPVAPENLPAVQSMQVTELVCPVAPENLPALQLVQTEEPAIYVHTLSHTTLGKFLHLYI